MTYDWTYIGQKVLEHKRQLLLGNLIAILATLVSIPVPLLFPVLVDEVLLDEPGFAVSAIQRMFPSSWHGAVLYISVVLAVTLILRVVGLALTVVQQRQFSMIAKDVIYRIRKSLLGRLEHISIAEYETLGSGSVASHFTTDLNTIDRFIGPTIGRLLISSLTLAGIAVTLLCIHWRLALVILIVNPIVVYITVRLGRWVKELQKKENSAVEKFQGALTEFLDTIYQVRANNREHHFIDRLVESAWSVRASSVKLSWQSDAANRFSFLVFLFGFDLFRALTMAMVAFSGLSVGFMVAIFSYLWFMMGPIQELLAMQYSYFGAKAAMGRINRLAQLKEEHRFPQLKNPFAGKSTVGLRLDDIHFAYGDGLDVLNGIRLEVAAGEKVALVGASGGGKSTLVHALLGLYPTKSGDIFFDGISVSEIGWDIVRENVAVALQFPALFNDTVRANLAVGRQFDDSELWHVLDLAQLKDDVIALDEGLDTMIGRQGVRLSGGQRQRLAIARLLLGDPKVVVLDEATSALDIETEEHLHAALRNFLHGRTTLVIAHRLSALRLVDRVCVFEAGVIVEQGSHGQLLAQNGLYAQLYGDRQVLTEDRAVPLSSGV